MNQITDPYQLFDIFMSHAIDFNLLSYFKLHYLMDKSEKLISSCELVRVLGEGSFGKVYLIRSLKTNKQYAVKKYSKYYLEKNGKQRSLIRSVWILQNLSHRGIIKFEKYIINSDEDDVYLIYQCCKKGSLSQLKQSISQCGDQKIIKFILSQLAEALLYLKSKSVAHRDLKPANITFTSDGQLKVIDFDEAVCFDNKYISISENDMLRSFADVDTLNMFNSRRSRASNYVGSEAYMAPQMRKDNACDEQADAWAFGCIMFELYVNELLYEDYEEEHKFELQCQQKLIKMNDLIQKDSRKQLALQLMTQILVSNPNKRIKIEDILKHSYFDQIRTIEELTNCRKKLRKLLRSNSTICRREDTIQNVVMLELINMKIGKELFQSLNTIVMLKYWQGYKICSLIGGVAYFKIKSKNDIKDVKYLHYNAIDALAIRNQHIVVTIKKEIWCKENTLNEEIQLKHLYPEMLGSLLQLMQAILQD